MLFAIAATQARDIGPITNAPAYSILRNCHDLSQSRLDHRRAFSAPYLWSLRASLFQLVMVKVMPYDVQFSKRFDEKFKYDDGSKISADTGIVSSAEENEEVIFQCRGERMKNWCAEAISVFLVVKWTTRKSHGSKVIIFIRWDSWMSDISRWTVTPPSSNPAGTESLTQPDSSGQEARRQNLSLYR